LVESIFRPFEMLYFAYSGHLDFQTLYTKMAI
jgi:hypothetical protein